FGAGTGAIQVGALQGGIFAGYKLSRVIVGLGLELSRVATGDRTGNVSTSQADTAIYVTPGVRVAIVRTADKRVELFGSLDIGLGTTIHEESPAPMGPQPDQTVFLLNYRLGPGVRFWAHPQFAISAIAGPQGRFSWVWTSVGTASNLD